MRGERHMITRWQRCMVLVAVALAVGWAGTGVAVGATPAEKCEARKLKAAGKKAECLAKEEAKEVLEGTSDPAECSDKFAEDFAKAEAKAGPGVCVTEGDAAAVEDQIDACTDSLAAALSGATPPATHLFPATGQTTCYTSGGTVIACTGTGQDGEIRAGAALSYTDNGDGTITDNNTGLMWAKKDDNNVDPLHDKDTTYNWANAFAVHIAGLNAGAGFAGYTDWRLPNGKELQSIINYETSTPAVASAFNTGCAANCTVLACSCTRAEDYWSSTSRASDAVHAWAVHFNEGFVGANFKSIPMRVRAVRGGL